MRTREQREKDRLRSAKNRAEKKANPNGYAAERIIYTNCLNCGASLEHKSFGAKYCCDQCNREAYYKKNPLHRSHIIQGLSGAAHELMAAVDLLDNNYYVFRNMAPHGPCDLIVLKNGITFMVEVAAGQIRRNGDKHPAKKRGRCFDWLATVFTDNTILWTDRDGRRISLSDSDSH